MKITIDVPNDPTMRLKMAANLEHSADDLLDRPNAADLESEIAATLRQVADALRAGRPCPRCGESVAIDCPICGGA